MDGKNYKSLDMSKIKDKKSSIVTSREALKDVTPINWSRDVLSGKKTITVTYDK